MALCVVSTVPGYGAFADDFESGTGEARAQILKTGPYTGRLDFTVGLGQSLVDYVGNVGRGQSKSVDFGLLGLLVTSHQCNGDPYVVNPEYVAPFTLRASTGDPGVDKGQTKSAVGPFGRQEVRATSDPTGRAVTTLAPFEVKGLLEVSGGLAEATTGVIRHQARESVGRVSISAVSLFGGLVRLEGLRWEATQHSRADGKVDRLTGTFELAAASIGGVPVSIANKSPGDIIDQVNHAIAYTGLALVTPRVTTRGGEAQITPLDLKIFDSKLASVTVRPAVAAAYPVRRPIADTIESVECRAAVPIAAADLTLTAMGGSGGTIVQFGGASASTDATRYANPFAFTVPPVLGAVSPATTPSVAEPLASIPAGGLPSISGGPAGLASAAAPATTAGLSSHVQSIPGGRGGAALVTGLLGLLAVLAIAAADYLGMRRKVSG